MSKQLVEKAIISALSALEIGGNGNKVIFPPEDFHKAVVEIGGSWFEGHFSSDQKIIVTVTTVNLRPEIESKGVDFSNESRTVSAWMVVPALSGKFDHWTLSIPGIVDCRHDVVQTIALDHLDRIQSTVYDYLRDYERGSSPTFTSGQRVVTA